MPHMYILECVDGSYYTGSTWELERRLGEHQSGLGANYTAKRLPVKLVYCEEYDRVDDAFRREKQVQGWTHKKKLALIQGDSNQLHELAMCQNESVGFGAFPQASAPLSQRETTARSLGYKATRTLNSKAARSLGGAEGNGEGETASAGFGSAQPTARCSDEGESGPFPERSRRERLRNGDGSAV